MSRSPQPVRQRDTTLIIPKQPRNPTRNKQTNKQKSIKQNKPKERPDIDTRYQEKEMYCEKINSSSEINSKPPFYSTDLDLAKDIMWETFLK